MILYELVQYIYIYIQLISANSDSKGPTYELVQIYIYIYIYIYIQLISANSDSKGPTKMLLS